MKVRVYGRVYNSFRIIPLDLRLGGGGGQSESSGSRFDRSELPCSALIMQSEGLRWLGFWVQRVSGVFGWVQSV